VNLVLRGLSGLPKRVMELWCTGAAALAMGYFAVQAVMMVWDTWRFGEKTKGLIIIDLWIPQGAMALGVAVLTIALADEFVRILRGATPAYVAQDAYAHPEDSL
jgi:TRAP-type C4-dicarboxylate transport system permease small subunit